MERLPRVLVAGRGAVPLLPDQRVADVLEELNVSTAMTLDCKPVRPGTNPMMIPRYPLDDPDYPGMAVLKQTDGYRMYYAP